MLERKSIPGGRASSYEAQETGEAIDNCQHILMRCCTNLRHFYARAGVEDRIRWVSRLRFLTPDGRQSHLGACRLPAPFHLLPSFFRVRFLAPRDKWGVARALMRMLLTPRPAEDLPFSRWLDAERQTPRAVARFWRPIVVSALNEDPERCSTHYAYHLFRSGFLGNRRAYEMGIPRCRLRELYDPAVHRLAAEGVEFHFREPVRALVVEGGCAAGVLTNRGSVPADYVVVATPWQAAQELLPKGLLPASLSQLQPSPICGVHLWWSRAVTDLDHVALLDRTIQWMFNKSVDYGGIDRATGAPHAGGTHMGLVVSASRRWLGLSRRAILAEAEQDIRGAFPGTAGADVVRAALIKEAAATYSPTPGVDALRPEPVTALRKVYLAGDWVRNGWPATMEAAVRSGYLAAECLLHAEGRPAALLQPDMAWEALLGRQESSPVTLATSRY